MFDFDIEKTKPQKVILAFNSSGVRDNGSYIFSQVELEELSFQIIYPGRDVNVSDYFMNLASEVIANIHVLNRVAKENTPDGEEGDHSLHYVKLSESEVELHYVYNLANASSGVYFKIESDGILVFDDWG